MKGKLERKAVVAEFKARDEPGLFEARFSRFGNVDRYGDRVLPGAFADVFKGDLPPVVWTHRWDIPPIGETLEARETDEGAEAVGRLFVKGDEDHEVARQVYAGLKSGALRQFSYAYTVADSQTVVEDGVEVREIARFAEVFEWGPTLVGVNPETELLSAPKALELLVGGRAESLALTMAGELLGAMKAGARHSAADMDMLRQIHDLAVELGVDCAAGKATAPDPDRARRARELLAELPHAAVVTTTSR